MNRGRLVLFLLLVSPSFTARAEDIASPKTIVPPTDQVNEFDARRELARVLRKLGETDAALNEMRKLLVIQPNDPLLLADLADLEASRGHFARSRDLYKRALTGSDDDPELRLRYARQARSWGDFYRAEQALRARLIRRPQDLETTLDLAGVLSAEQRYEAAETEYRRLAKNPATRTRALIAMATNHLFERDFQAVLPPADAVLKADPDQPEALTLRAEALRRLRRYEEAKESFRRLSALPGSRRSGWIGLGRVAEAQMEEAGAGAYVRRAQPSASDDITARYRYLLAGERAASAGHLRQLAAHDGLTIAELSAAADLQASEGKLESAIALYRAALAKDPEYFPARIGLAQALATAHRYDESIKLLTGLRDDFPGNAKITLALARVLSWSRRYETAVQTYRELIRLNPSDTVPRTEMARVAAWSNRMRLARDLYAEVCNPSVDWQLRKTLQRSGQNRAVLGADEQVHGGSAPPYEYYERLCQLRDSGQLVPDARPAVEAALYDWEPMYRLQKAAWLEGQAKWLAWDKKFLHAAQTYQELLAFQPGNEEARFDLAELEAAQDLSLKSAANYQELLELDPLHSLASRALERERILQSPDLFSRYTYWDEKGIGRASNIERQHVQSGAEFAWNGQLQVRFGGDYWVESPGFGGQADAGGATIGIRTVINDYWRASAEWSHKEYFNARNDPTDTGQAGVTFNAWDYARVTFQYARLDELHNEFGLQQGVQSDNLGLLFDSDLNHWVGVNGGAVWTHYTDDNQGIWVTLAPAFILHDHPHTLKLALRADYRNTQNASVFEHRGSRLVDIIHPYWTPQDYTRASVILEWRHDLSHPFYAGAQQHYYALRLGGGVDSSGNKNFLLEGEWHYDFLPHWSLDARGTLDRSSAWDGAAASLSLVYHF